MMMIMDLKELKLYLMMEMSIKKAKLNKME